ncbi:hypothetical protein DFH27DRAFT_525727 [Peziza echinospora]|nr:hypothetical protein DFH27DRAFT_525727 [Peziza echinospora]
MSHSSSKHTPAKGSDRSIGDADEDEEEIRSRNRHFIDSEDMQLVPQRRSGSNLFAGTKPTLIPMPGRTSPIPVKKSNIPSGFSPMDKFHRRTAIDRNHNERKRTLGGESWDLNGGAVSPSPKRAATGSKMESSPSVRPRRHPPSKSQNLAELLHQSPADSAESCNRGIETQSDGSKKFRIPRSKLLNHGNNIYDHQQKMPAKKNTMAFSQKDSDDDLDIVDEPKVPDSGLLTDLSQGRDVFVTLKHTRNANYSSRDIIKRRLHQFENFKPRASFEKSAPRPAQESPYFVPANISPSTQRKLKPRKEIPPSDPSSSDEPTQVHVLPRRTLRQHQHMILDDPIPKEVPARKFTPEPEWRSPLVWPRTGAKRVTVDHVDLNRLNEGEFLNDNLINFYLRYIEEHLKEENPILAQRTHFFNTFFYERLCKRPEKRGGDNWSQDNIQSLLKWTSRVDLFSKSFVVVPINEHYHWYLAIICNLDKLENQVQASIIEENLAPKESASTDDLAVESEMSEVTDHDVQPDVQPDVLTNDKQSRQPTPAEEKLIPEKVVVETETSFDRMNIDEVPDTDSSDWPDEDGLEGKRTEAHITNFEPRPEFEEKRVGKKPLPKPRKPVAISPDKPTIFILDSLNTNNHMRAFKVLKEYLQAEAKSKKHFEFPPKTISGTYTKVPEQPNFCDCGVYLLWYVERFLQRPDEFTQGFLRKEDQNENFDQTDVASMRKRLRDTIIKLKKEEEVEPEDSSTSSDEVGEIEEIEELRGRPEPISQKGTPAKRKDGTQQPAWASGTPSRNSEEPKEQHARGSSASRHLDSRGLGSKDDITVPVKKYTPEEPILQPHNELKPYSVRVPVYPRSGDDDSLMVDAPDSLVQSPNSEVGIQPFTTGG